METKHVTTARQTDRADPAAQRGEELIFTWRPSWSCSACREQADALAALGRGVTRLHHSIHWLGIWSNEGPNSGLGVGEAGSPTAFLDEPAAWRGAAVPRTRRGLGRALTA